MRCEGGREEEESFLSELDIPIIGDDILRSISLMLHLTAWSSGTRLGEHLPTVLVLPYIWEFFSSGIGLF